MTKIDTDSCDGAAGCFIAAILLLFGHVASESKHVDIMRPLTLDLHHCMKRTDTQRHMHVFHTNAASNNANNTTLKHGRLNKMRRLYLIGYDFGIVTESIVKHLETSTFQHSLAPFAFQSRHDFLNRGPLSAQPKMRFFSLHSILHFQRNFCHWHRFTSHILAGSEELRAPQLRWGKRRVDSATE